MSFTVCQKFGKKIFTPMRKKKAFDYVYGMFGGHSVSSVSKEIFHARSFQKPELLLEKSLYPAKFILLKYRKTYTRYEREIFVDENEIPHQLTLKLVPLSVENIILLKLEGNIRIQISSRQVG
jgi:hypothetical protein